MGVLTLSAEGIGELEIVRGGFVFTESEDRAEAFYKEWDDCADSTAVVALAEEIQQKSAELYALINQQ